MQGFVEEQITIQTEFPTALVTLINLEVSEKKCRKDIIQLFFKNILNIFYTCLFLSGRDLLHPKQIQDSAGTSWNGSSGKI